METRIVQAVAGYDLNGIAEVIANAVNEWDADLVVVGTSHRRGLQLLVIGSVAEQLIAKVDASFSWFVRIRSVQSYQFHSSQPLFWQFL